MDTNPSEDTPQATAAVKLAAVAADLARAAASAPTPAERLLLMRQWRKVQAAHDALVNPDAINTQSIPVQAPAAPQQQATPDSATQAALPAGLLQRLKLRR